MGLPAIQPQSGRHDVAMGASPWNIPPHITKAPKGRHEMESRAITDGTTSPRLPLLLRFRARFRARAQSAVADGTRHRNRKTLRGGTLDIFEFEFEREREHEREHEHEILSSTKAKRQVDSTIFPSEHGRVVLNEPWGHPCRCFATPTFPLDGFLGLASGAFAWHCSAIPS